jgi:hypothetical protein
MTHIGLEPTIDAGDAKAEIGTRIVVGEDRQLVWATRGTSVQVSVHNMLGHFEFVLATAKHGFSYEAALAAYALLKEDQDDA